MDSTTTEDNQNHMAHNNGFHGQTNLNNNYETKSLEAECGNRLKDKTNVNESENTGDIVRDFSYGCFGTRTKCLQALNKAGWLLFFMCIANVFQSMVVNGLIGTILSSLETRFGFTSSQSSWIVSAYDVSTIPMLILISYFGSRSHRAMWTGIGLLVLVIGSVIMVLPHFLSSEYRPTSSGEDVELCRSYRTGDPLLCDSLSEGEGDGGYLAIFIVARLFYGLGAVPLYTMCHFFR